MILALAGVASWFNPPSAYGSARVCAMNAVPIRSRVLIVNTDNRRRSYCRVVGTGPFVTGRIIDVSPSVRDELGMGGLAHVSVYLVY